MLQLKKAFIISLSTLLLCLGLVSMVTPLPGGTLMIAISLTALIYHSVKVRLCLQWMRSRMPRLNSMFYWLEDKVGERFNIVQTTLAQTRPDEGTEYMNLSHREYIRHHIEVEHHNNQGKK